MKLLLIVLCVILLKESIDANLLAALANGERVKFGRLDAQVKVEGQLPPKYPVLTDVDKRATRDLAGYIQKLQHYFANGISFAFVPLDPFLKTEIEPFNVDIGKLYTRVGLRNLMVLGLSKFRLYSLETRMDGLRVDFNFSFPVLEVNVDCTFTINTALGGGMLPQSFLGHVHGQVVNLNLCGATQIQVESRLGISIFQMRALELNATADDVEVQATAHNLGFIEVDEFSWGAKHPDIQGMKKQVAESAVKKVAHEINKYLLNFSASKILKNLQKGRHTS